MEKKVASLIEEAINDLGFGLVQVKMRGSENKVVEILIEREDGEKVQVGDCQLVSRNISAILDVEDAISGKYFLEVSSAGIERPLVKPEDFVRFTGREVKLRLYEALNGNLSFKGELLGMQEDTVKLKSKNIELSFEYSNIKSAKLVLTDKLFRELLNKNKK